MGWRSVLGQGVWLPQTQPLLAGTLGLEGGRGKRMDRDRAWALETHWPWTHIVNTGLSLLALVCGDAPATCR